jgi:RNA polymerase sigma factor (sigma-70 family)
LGASGEQTMNEPLEDLVTRAVMGDRAALTSVCAAVQGPVYRLALRMLGGAQDAEDCTQEILVLVVTHLAQFDGRSRFTTWVYTIASRHLLRARKSRQEEKAVPIGDVALAVEQGLALTPPSAEPAGDARLLARDVQRTCTQAMLLALSREERLAVLLADVLGATDAVGASISEIGEAAFRKRLERGRATLRPILEAACGLADEKNPCRCARQAVTKQTMGLKLPVYRDPADDGPVSRANDQMGELARLGHVFVIDPPPLPRKELWHELERRFPDLLG